MNRYFDLLCLWMRKYFKHPVENIRQARPIKPGRLYRNFGNICKAVPYKKEDLRFLNEYEEAAKQAEDENTDTPSGLPLKLVEGLSQDVVMEMVKGCNKNFAKSLEASLCMKDKPGKCYLCDFEKNGIPCPVYNALEDGRCVCNHYKYIIIKKAPNVY